MVFGAEWQKECDRIPKVLNRVSLIVFKSFLLCIIQNFFQTSMTISLIRSYGLLDQLVQIKPQKASRGQLEAFHSSAYLDYCEAAGKSDDLEKLEMVADNKFGIEYDCPIVPDIFNLIQWIAGGSLAAAEALNRKECQVALNWGGGWHHAQRDEASGFCYVNDIVLAIQHLRKVHDKVLYVDLDVHHGDGVENAFSYSPKIFTFSIHKFESGYFPGSGTINDVGHGKGRFYSLNFPLKDGIDDTSYSYIFDSILSEISYAFQPDAIVVQCGADCLANDPLGGFSLSPRGISSCIGKVLRLAKPTLLLGGGGYNPANAARFWTFLTGLLVRGEDLPSDIPDCDPYFEEYGPSFEIDLLPGQRRNCNSKEDIDDLLEETFRNLEEI